MATHLVADDLAAGDVLLYCSKTVLGRMIRRIDASPVSHAGLFLGGIGQQASVGEALTDHGLQRRPLSESIDGCTMAVRRLADGVADMTPVLNVAEAYLRNGQRYAYGQIVLLAGICLLRRMDIENPVKRRMAQLVIDRAADVVRSCQRRGKQPMICSEFVYRCHHEAVSTGSNPYDIEIEAFWSDKGQLRLLSRDGRERALSAIAAVSEHSLLGVLRAEYGSLETVIGAPGTFAAASGSRSDEEELEEVLEACCSDSPGRKAESLWAAATEVRNNDLRRSVANFAAALHEEAASAAASGERLRPAASPPRTPAEALADFSADFVTPGDLFRSRSLKTVVELG